MRVRSMEVLSMCAFFAAVPFKQCFFRSCTGIRQCFRTRRSSLSGRFSPQLLATVFIWFHGTHCVINYANGKIVVIVTSKNAQTSTNSLSCTRRLQLNGLFGMLFSFRLFIAFVAFVFNPLEGCYHSRRAPIFFHFVVPLVAATKCVNIKQCNFNAHPKEEEKSFEKKRISYIPVLPVDLNSCFVPSAAINASQWCMCATRFHHAQRNLLKGLWIVMWQSYVFPCDCLHNPFNHIRVVTSVSSTKPFSFESKCEAPLVVCLSLLKLIWKME